MKPADLQAWGKCSRCGMVMWCEVSPHDQRCGCECGGLELCNCAVSGTADQTFTEAELQPYLDAEYGAE